MCACACVHLSAGIIGLCAAQFDTPQHSHSHTHKRVHTHPHPHTRAHPPTHTHTRARARPPAQRPEHTALIPLVEAALAIMRLSCEKYFVLLTALAAHLVFRERPPRAVRAYIQLVARLSAVFQKVSVCVRVCARGHACLARSSRRAQLLQCKQAAPPGHWQPS